MKIIQGLPFTVDKAALLKAAHIDPDDDMAEECLDLAARAEPVARPKAVYGEAFVERIADGRVFLEGGFVFESAVMAEKLAGVGRVFPCVATCGAELDTLRTEVAGDPLGEFWLDLVKLQALMVANKALDEEVRKVYALSRTVRMAPGSGDADVWPITQQKELFRLLGDVEGTIGVHLTDSCLMVPNKTVSGIIFPSDTDFKTCSLCHRANCPNRRAPLAEK